MNRIEKFLMALVVVAALGASASAANIFLSTVNTIGGGAAVGDPTVNLAPGGNGTLYLWVTDELLVDRGLAVNIAVTGPAGVVNLTAAQAYNFDLHTTLDGANQGDSGSNRWQAVSNFLPGNAHVTPTLIQNLNAVTATDTGGIRAANSGPASGPGLLDLGYDVSAHAFLYGQVAFSGVSIGSTTIALQASALGIAQGGGNISNQFTFGMATLNVMGGVVGDVNSDGVVNIFDINLVSANWGTAGPTGDANHDAIVNIFDINLISANWSPPPGSGGAAAVPEPGSLALAALGLVGLVDYRWRQRRRQ